jgi:hypothetical protein
LPPVSIKAGALFFHINFGYAFRPSEIKTRTRKTTALFTFMLRHTIRADSDRDAPHRIPDFDEISVFNINGFMAIPADYPIIAHNQPLRCSGCVRFNDISE